jgi:uncharacterized protein (DUF1786 family)
LVEGRRILAVDVGAGTQDILVYEERGPVENSPRMVMPSPTLMVARAIRRATVEGRPIYFHGHLMGGGPCTRALGAHLDGGLSAYSTPDAALTFSDNLERVARMGVSILEDGEAPPPKAVAIALGDLNLKGISQALSSFGVAMPGSMAVAVQDHGHGPTESNRVVRFRHWKAFVDGSGNLWDLGYRDVPASLTRMRSVQDQAPGCLVMDTGPAAILGMLQDEAVAAMAQEGFIGLNVGNAHTVALLILGERVLGVLEEHTGLMTTRKLASRLEAFSRGTLTHSEVYSEGGHGCHIHGDYLEVSPFAQVAITGPRRYLAQGMGVMASPHGDMMLTGCFGLVAAALKK